MRAIAEAQDLLSLEANQRTRLPVKRNRLNHPRYLHSPHLQFQTGSLHDEFQVRRRHTRKIIKAFDEILRASLCFGKVRNDDKVFPFQVFGERDAGQTPVFPGLQSCLFSYSGARRGHLRRGFQRLIDVGDDVADVFDAD